MINRITERRACGQGPSCTYAISLSSSYRIYDILDLFGRTLRTLYAYDSSTLRGSKTIEVQIGEHQGEIKPTTMPHLHTICLRYIDWKDTAAILARCDFEVLKDIECAVAGDRKDALFGARPLLGARNLRLGNPSFGTATTNENWSLLAPDVTSLQITIDSDKIEQFAKSIKKARWAHLKKLFVWVWMVPGDADIGHGSDPRLDPLLTRAVENDFAQYITVGIRQMMTSWYVCNRDLLHDHWH